MSFTRHGVSSQRAKSGGKYVGGAPWPRACPSCLGCGRKPPQAFYHTRGLCTVCYKYWRGAKALTAWPRLPLEINDESLATLETDPMAYLTHYMGRSSASELARMLGCPTVAGWRLYVIAQMRWLGYTSVPPLWPSKADTPRPGDRDASMLPPQRWTCLRGAERASARAKWLRRPGPMWVARLYGAGAPAPRRLMHAARGWCLVWGYQATGSLVRVLVRGKKPVVVARGVREPFSVDALRTACIRHGHGWGDHERADAWRLWVEDIGADPDTSIDA